MSVVTEAIGPQSRTLDEPESKASRVLLDHTQPSDPAIANCEEREAELRRVLYGRKQVPQATLPEALHDYRPKPAPVCEFTPSDRVLILSFLQAFISDTIGHAQSPPHPPSSTHRHLSFDRHSPTSVADITGTPLGCEHDHPLTYHAAANSRLFPDTKLPWGPYGIHDSEPAPPPSVSGPALPLSAQSRTSTTTMCALAAKKQPNLTTWTAFATLCAILPNPFAASGVEWPTTVPGFAYDCSQNYSFTSLPMASKGDNLVESISSSSLCQLSSQDSGVFFTT